VKPLTGNRGHEGVVCLYAVRVHDVEPLAPQNAKLVPSEDQLRPEYCLARWRCDEPSAVGVDDEHLAREIALGCAD
jgi:hypothetical protein